MPSLPVRVELEAWFALAVARTGGPRVERLEQHERSLPVVELMGRRGFFTDANACLARAAWERVPFREVPYAEDRVLAIDMLRAGYAKAFVPRGRGGPLPRLFRAASSCAAASTSGEVCARSTAGVSRLRPAHLLGAARRARPRTRDQRSPRTLARRTPPRDARGRRPPPCDMSQAGALLGSRADRLPPGARRRLSLERRGGFAPLHSGRRAAGHRAHISSQ